MGGKVRLVLEVDIDGPGIARLVDDDEQMQAAKAFFKSALHPSILPESEEIWRLASKFGLIGRGAIVMPEGEVNVLILSVALTEPEDAKDASKLFEMVRRAMAIQGPKEDKEPS